MKIKKLSNLLIDRDKATRSLSYFVIAVTSFLIIGAIVLFIMLEIL